MTDSLTKRSLHVTRAGASGGFIDLPASQIAEVKNLLDRHRRRFWVSEHVITYGNGPELGRIVLSQNENPDAVQAILDNA